MRGLYLCTLGTVLGIMLGLGRYYPVMLAIGLFTGGFACLAILRDSRYCGPERRRAKRTPVKVRSL